MIARSSVFLDYRSQPANRLGRALPACLAVFLLALLFGFTPAACAQTQPPPHELHIAAAADLQPVMPALAAAYEHATGTKVVASFGSSATLTQQLLNGDPQDIFLSADYLHPEQVISAGLGDGTQPTPYARGVLVLWARTDSPAQPLTLQSLEKPSVAKIAVANDLHAPYGLAATRAIAALGLTDKLKPKLVIAENVGQAAQFASTGNAQAAFISLTLANSDTMRAAGTFVRVPAVYPTIQQCGVVLKKAKDLSIARNFLQWLASAAVQSNLPKLGLDPLQ